MLTRWVYRVDLEGVLVSAPLKCIVEGVVVPEPGMRTVSQCIAAFLAVGEGCEAGGDIRPVLKDRRIVGYIHINRRHPES